MFRRPARDEAGFTLIEVGVGVLVAAVLLAIAIPTFTGSRDRSVDRQAQQDLRASLTSARSYFLSRQSYSGIAAALPDAEKNIQYREAATNIQDGKVAISVVSGVLYLSRVSDTGTCFFIRDDGLAEPKYGRLANCAGIDMTSGVGYGSDWSQEWPIGSPVTPGGCDYYGGGGPPVTYYDGGAETQAQAQPAEGNIYENPDGDCPPPECDPSGVNPCDPPDDCEMQLDNGNETQSGAQSNYYQEPYDGCYQNCEGGQTNNVQACPDPPICEASDPNAQQTDVWVQPSDDCGGGDTKCNRWDSCGAPPCLCGYEWYNDGGGDVSYGDGDYSEGGSDSNLGAPVSSD